MLEWIRDGRKTPQKAFRGEAKADAGAGAAGAPARRAQLCPRRDHSAPAHAGARFEETATGRAARAQPAEGPARARGRWTWRVADRAGQSRLREDVRLSPGFRRGWGRPLPVRAEDRGGCRAANQGGAEGARAADGMRLSSRQVRPSLLGRGRRLPIDE